MHPKINEILVYISALSNPVRIQVLEGLLGELPIAKVLSAVFRYLLGVLFSSKMVNISLMFTLTVSYYLPFL